MPRGLNDATATKKERIAAAIEACRNAAGIIEEERVVEAAKDPNNVLHGEFEWNITLAAYQSWLARARELIRECRTIVVYADRTIAVPIYISNPRAGDGGYVRTLSVARNATLKKMALQAEVARIRGAIRRAMSLAITFNLAHQFERMLEQVIAVELELEGRDDDGDGDGARPTA